MMEVVFDPISVFGAKIKQFLKYAHALQPAFAQRCEEMAASLYPRYGQLCRAHS